MSNPMDFLKGTEAEVKAAEFEPLPELTQETAKRTKVSKPAKAVEPVEPPEYVLTGVGDAEDIPFIDEVKPAEVNPYDLADYQECRVSHKMKYRLNEDLEREAYPEFEVEKKLRITSIQHNQAELLNSQSANSNLRYYLIKK